MLNRPLLIALLLAPLPAIADVPRLYGLYEHVRIHDIDRTLKAKMDTGAMTASLSARDIEQFERDGEDWVRFRLAVEGAGERVHEHRLARISEIKTRAEEGAAQDGEGAARSPGVATRPVIELEICIGEARRPIEVNLTDRSHFSYPLLIGSTAIREFDGAIDPARKYTADQPDC